MVILISSLTLTENKPPTRKITEQKAALGAVDGDLANELVEALGVELLPLGADSGLPRLPPLELVLEGRPELDHLRLRRGRALHGLDPELLLLHGVLPGRKDRVQNVLRLGLRHVFLVLLPETLAGLALLGGGDLGWVRRVSGGLRAARWRTAPAIGSWGSYRPLLVLRVSDWCLKKLYF